MQRGKKKRARTVYVLCGGDVLEASALYSATARRPKTRASAQRTRRLSSRAFLLFFRNRAWRFLVFCLHSVPSQGIEGTDLFIVRSFASCCSVSALHSARSAFRLDSSRPLTLLLTLVSLVIAGASAAAMQQQIASRETISQRLPITISSHFIAPVKKTAKKAKKATKLG